jgi:hypothetical protein
VYMTPYSIAVFLHVVAVLGLFVALGAEWLLLSNILLATDTAEARSLVRASAMLPRVAFSSLVFILLTGVYLEAKAKLWTMPWIQVSLGAIVLTGFLGGVAERRRRAMPKPAANDSRTSLDIYRCSAADAVLQTTVRVRFATALAAVLLMVTRSDMTASVLIMGAALASGSFWSAPTWKRRFIQRSTS